jgi:N-acetyl-1-D-myo-inositol-2-amino-2-deoxy-alpha-D-glucopyranoside deacetylase
VIANLPPDARERLFATEWYIRHIPITATSAQTELTA